MSSRDIPRRKVEFDPALAGRVPTQNEHQLVELLQLLNTVFDVYGVLCPRWFLNRSFPSIPPRVRAVVSRTPSCTLHELDTGRQIRPNGIGLPFRVANNEDVGRLWVGREQILDMRRPFIDRCNPSDTTDPPINVRVTMRSVAGHRDTVARQPAA